MVRMHEEIDQRVLWKMTRLKVSYRSQEEIRLWKRERLRVYILIAGRARAGTEEGSQKVKKRMNQQLQELKQ